MNKSRSTYKTTEDQWPDLAKKAQDGDKRAYNKLLSEIALFINNYLITRLANPEWADDVTQEVLISVHKALHTYSSDRPFKPWLIAIINFRKTDFLRKHYASRADKQSPLDVLDYENNFVTNQGDVIELRDVERALEKIPEKQRKVFELIKIQGYTAKETAEKMGMSVSAVKVSAHRTSGKLQKTLRKKEA